MYGLNIQRFGGRGQNYTPKAKTTKELKKAFGKRGQSIEPEQAYIGANPNFETGGTQYRINCQKCVYAYELRRRGYDVEALPTDPSKFDPMRQGGGWYNAFENQTWERNLGQRNNTVYKKISSKMDKWGEGSRAIIYVAWALTNSAHVFNIEQRNGKVYAYDPQSRREVDLQTRLSATKPSKTMISRVDNLKTPKDVLQYAVKVKEKK